MTFALMKGAWSVAEFKEHLFVGWMYGWMDGWLNEWMDERTDGQTDRRVNELNEKPSDCRDRLSSQAQPLSF